MLTNYRPLDTSGLLEILFEASVGKITSKQNDTKKLNNELSRVKLLF